MIDLNPGQLATVKAILAEHVPECEVRAFGSRVTWTAKDYSDLDLAVVGEGPVDWRTLGRLKEAFEESDLPMRADVLDWHAISDGFRRVVERDNVVLWQGLHPDTATRDTWQERAFEDVIDFREGPGILAKDFREHGIPLVRLAGLNGGASLLEGCNFLDPEAVSTRWSHFRLELGDILLSTSASLGRIAVVGQKGIGAVPYTGIIRMRPRGDDLYAPFIRYLLEGPDFQLQAEMVGVGSVIRHFGPMHLRQMTVRIPPLPEQRAIAHVLGTLDDKIELNRRMNETLEEMARALFKSWFVDFDPVRAKMEGRWHQGESLPGLPADLYDLFPDRLVQSALGEIPEGWEIKALGTFGEIITGKTPSTKPPEYYGEDTPFLRIPDMHGKMFALKTEIMLSALGAESQSKKTLPPGSVSVSCIATPGLVVLNHRDTQTNQQINSIIPYDQSASSYLYWTCCHLSSDIATGGLGGSVFGNMNKSTFSALVATYPERTIVRAFDALVSPIHEAILANEEQANTLSIQRDALLLVLLSGEVEV